MIPETVVLQLKTRVTANTLHVKKRDDPLAFLDCLTRSTGVLYDVCAVQYESRGSENARGYASTGPATTVAVRLNRLSASALICCTKVAALSTLLIKSSASPAQMTAVS